MKDFLRLLGHDLQNQAGAIDLNLQILPTLVAETDPSYAKIEPFITRAHLATADLISMLEDIQYYARNREKEHETGDMDLSACARDTALTLQSLAGRREVKFTTKIQDGVHALAEGEAVRRAMKILASDAIRGGFPGSTAELRITASPVPMIEIMSSVEGLFEESRPTVSTFLVKEILQASRATVVLSRTAQILLLPT